MTTARPAPLKSWRPTSLGRKTPLLAVAVRPTPTVAAERVKVAAGECPCSSNGVVVKGAADRSKTAAEKRRSRWIGTAGCATNIVSAPCA